jgi:4-hydroxy-2-oxoheptanedioate aldolase
MNRKKWSIVTDDAITLRQLLREESIVIGTFIGLGSCAAVEVVAWRGFEFVCIDTEHAALNAETVEQLIRAAEGAGVPALVRVPGLGSDIGRALDSGAVGVVVPHVETAEDARSAVRAVRYPPDGERGVGPGRATRFAQYLNRYVETANDRLAVIVMVETVRGVENAAEIAAVDGVDVVFVGPGDLAASMAVSAGSDEHRAVIERVMRTVDASGKAFGIFSSTGDDIPKWASLGATFFIMASDYGLLGRFAESELARVKTLLASE